MDTEYGVVLDYRADATAVELSHEGDTWVVTYVLPDGAPPLREPIPSGQLRHDLTEEELADPARVVDLVEDRLRVKEYEPKRRQPADPGVVVAGWTVNQG
jgi:hypothetical protein